MGLSSTKTTYPSTPMWISEINVNAAWSNDPHGRPWGPLGVAWWGSTYAQLAPLNVSILHQYNIVETTQKLFEANGVVVVLWAREKLAADMGIRDDDARCWGGIALAHNVGTNEEVDRVVEEARANGAEVTREPAETFYGGYASGFRDPDGHAWEIAHNPGFGLTDDGSVIIGG